MESKSITKVVSGRKITLEDNEFYMASREMGPDPYLPVRVWIKKVDTHSMVYGDPVVAFTCSLADANEFIDSFNGDGFGGTYWSAS